MQQKDKRYCYIVHCPDGATCYMSGDEPCHSPYLEAITEDEYDAAIAELNRRAEEEAIAEQQTKDERIEELEAENAALLFQLLTGEEFDDV